MQASSYAHWMLEQEARALLARLARVKPFVLSAPMVLSASLLPAAQIAIERRLPNQSIGACEIAQLRHRNRP